MNWDARMEEMERIRAERHRAEEGWADYDPFDWRVQFTGTPDVVHAVAKVNQDTNVQTACGVESTRWVFSPLERKVNCEACIVARAARRLRGKG